MKKQICVAAGILAALLALSFTVWAEEGTEAFAGGRIDLIAGEGEKVTAAQLGCPGGLPLEVITGKQSILASAQADGTSKGGWVRLRAQEAGVEVALVRMQDGQQEKMIPIAITSRRVLQVEPEKNLSITPQEMGDFITFVSAQVNPVSPSLQAELYTRSDGAKMLRLRGGEERGLAFLAVELAREDGTVQAFHPWFTPVLVQEGPRLEEDLVYWREIREELLSAGEGAVVHGDAAKHPKIHAGALEAVKGSGASLVIQYFDQTVTITQQNLPDLEDVIYLDFQQLKKQMK